MKKEVKKFKTIFDVAHERGLAMGYAKVKAESHEDWARVQKAIMILINEVKLTDDEIVESIGVEMDFVKGTRFLMERERRKNG